MLSEMRPRRSVWSMPHSDGTLTRQRRCTFISHAVHSTLNHHRPSLISVGVSKTGIKTRPVVSQSKSCLTLNTFTSHLVSVSGCHVLSVSDDHVLVSLSSHACCAVSFASKTTNLWRFATLSSSRAQSAPIELCYLSISCNATDKTIFMLNIFTGEKSQMSWYV